MIKERAVLGEVEAEFRPVKRNLFEEEFQSISNDSTFSKEAEVELLAEIQEYARAIRREQLLFDKRTSDNNPENSAKADIGNVFVMDFEVFDRIGIKYRFNKQDLLSKLKEYQMRLE
mmetsp:Transcript_24172/g.18407  ORF Transcript_24172/g.18407 Transcript_24172/m.18407 type:complete len:117 (-) Transcript_24172:35-385(-)|eukprot:CAMPEP_0202959104 /NCGR_PEP_ID=MMETSP1396-20130829/3387_1 /ASSEMBLY_ACC=CAM_ASM_000872 /TAXON_ID= /ORGANISM="Pseudokeronopsis sp., Strain Brazil" /LENGTH=116 /DNA_ID=CAMNT_0049677535 /DNA_START=492 /DNA_END=842 /DNA_ORIENTATION=-